MNGMENFGKALRYYRNQSTDPERGGKLTQERLAELLEKKGLFYTGAAISDWERGKTRISIDDRLVLLALIQVFNTCGGIRPDEANDLLETGNYRALSISERDQIFADQQVHPLPVIPGKEWSQWLLDGMSYILRNWEAADVVRAVFWVVLWYALWKSISPLMNWPLHDMAATRIAGVLAAGGSFLTPILVGVLTQTRMIPFWVSQGCASDPRLRCLTYIGAGTGFLVAYLFSFGVVIFLYNLNVELPSSAVAGVAAFFCLLLSAATARRVPVNHFRAYKSLHLRPALILTSFFFIGPLWSVYLISFSSVLLSPPVGAFFILVMIALVAAANIKRKPISSDQ